MTVNEGAEDRIIRLIVTAEAVLVSWWAGFGSVAGIILLLVAGIAFITGVSGYCRPGSCSRSARARRRTGSPRRGSEPRRTTSLPAISGAAVQAAAVPEGSGPRTWRADQ
jgi:hypothetical protein